MHSERAGAHGEDVAQDPADAGGGALERLYIGGVVVRLDLEGAGPAIADIDDAGVFSRPLDHAGPEVRSPRVGRRLRWTREDL